MSQRPGSTPAGAGRTVRQGTRKLAPDLDRALRGNARSPPHSFRTDRRYPWFPKGPLAWMHRRRRQVHGPSPGESLFGAVARSDLRRRLSQPGWTLGLPGRPGEVELDDARDRAG